MFNNANNLEHAARSFRLHRTMILKNPLMRTLIPPKHPPDSRHCFFTKPKKISGRCLPIVPTK